MEIKNFKDMYLAELQELASAESQVADILPRMAGAVVNPALKQALLRQCEQAETRRKRVTSLLAKRDAHSNGHTDQAMQALIHETEKMLTMLKGEELRDAGLIASAQRLQHYEIAGYGIAAALAGQLDFRDDQKQLHRSLEEEKQADVLLTNLAKGEVNRDALSA